MKKLIRFTIFAACVSFFNLIIAQETNVNGRDYIERDAPTGMNTIKFIDFSLQRTKEHNNSSYSKKSSTSKYIRVGVESEGVRRTKTRNPQVWALLRNYTDYDYQLEARVQFFDPDMMPSEQQSAWKKIYLPANAIGTYKEFGINPSGVFYVVEVREAR